jgi:hypothetical protein
MTISALREFVTLPDCVVFVGSGISMWSGLPSWKRLLGDLASRLEAEGQSAELVRREIAGGDLLQAASYGVSKLTPATFGSFMRQAVRFGDATPHVIHKAIVELGPTSFITTNYDTLIEQALGAWRSGIFFPAAVTNRHLVELADIVRARSSHFIFKPHGDANDLESIILTREQYRLLLPGGERHKALEALKTLLVTRPVLYLGFSLRDPDFIHLRDLLFNIYQGSVRDHWAIMPDVTPDEADYWRLHYGIKLHRYETREGADGSRDHRELLCQLEALAASGKIAATPICSSGESKTYTEAERVLALTRYTSGMVRRLAFGNDLIEVHISRVRKPSDFKVTLDRFDGWTTMRFLTHGPQTAYLIGLPGTGKSLALRLAARRLASRLQQACIDDALAETSLTLPILIDLKLYQGDLRAQIDAELPAGFTLTQLRGSLHLKLFLDAFNEMPTEHLEAGTLFASLDALNVEIGPFDLVVASRTPDGIPTQADDNIFYEIDMFDEDHVEALLATKGIKLEGPFANEIRRLLSRPFFLHLVANNMVELPGNPRPRDLYASFASKLQEQFSERFATELELLPIFSRVAYRAIAADTEAFPLAWLTDLLDITIPHDATFTATEVANWLVGRQVLTSYSGRRASFVHQSVTEYCAAVELARRSRVDVVPVREIIASKRWDQCLFLALALMEPETAEQILKDAIETDLRLAANAVRYAEEGQSASVSCILQAVIEHANAGEQWAFWWLRKLPVGPEHVTLLNRIIELRNVVGGRAVELLADLKGVSCKPQLLNLLEAHAGEYNFSHNGIAIALGSMLDDNDLPRLLRVAGIWQGKGNADGCSAIGYLLSRYEPEILLAAFGVAIEDMSPQTASLLSMAMRNRKDAGSIKVLSQLVLTHPNESVADFALAMRSTVGKEPASMYSCLDCRHVERIWSVRLSGGLWDSALSIVCQVRLDLADRVMHMADARSGMEAIALRYCAGADKKALISILERLLERDDSSLQDEPFALVDLRNLDWWGREQLLARSLSRDLPALRKALLEDSFEPRPLRRGVLDLSTLRPVIEIVRDLPGDQESWFQRDRLSSVVAQLGNAEVQAYCLASLVDGPDWLRDWAKRYYIRRVDSLTSDSLDDNMIAVLLADLNIKDGIHVLWNNPLGRIATDRLVVERLLPLAESASATFRRNLSLVLRAAGDRHGKRYRMPC